MLTDTKIKQAKVAEKPYKIYDAEGLYIEIAPTGSKRWRWRYRWNGKEKLLSFGIYPEVPLKLARDRRTAAKELLVSGVDPSQARKEEKVESRAAVNSFAAMAEEWYALYSVPWSEHYKEQVRRRIDEYLIPRLGKRALSEITPIEIMGILTALEKRGVIETANRVLGICSQIFRRAVATGRAKSDPCRDLRGALAPAEERHHAALTTKEGARAVMRALDAYQGSAVVCAAVRFTALTFVRQVGLRFATWDEINWEERMWLIPAERMKMRREHMVPLSRQAIAVPTPGGMQELKVISESGLYALIFRSRKPEAKAFSKWVRSEVLPNLRKTGGYGAPAQTAPGVSREELEKLIADKVMDTVFRYRDLIADTAQGVKALEATRPVPPAEPTEREILEQCIRDYVAEVGAAHDVATARDECKPIVNPNMARGNVLLNITFSEWIGAHKAASRLRIFTTQALSGALRRMYCRKINLAYLRPDGGKSSFSLYVTNIHS